MDWTKFQTYDESNTKSFETLCNHLFENWCYDEYKDNIKSFQVVNGSGGDGGVESFAILNDSKVVGMQAKWFRESLNSNQLNQIKNSIETALRIRPQISRYIVCIPRDISSLTGKGEGTEDKRWYDLVNLIKNQYPNLELELWNNFRISKELHKESSVGILKFWFKNSEISDDKIKNAFEMSKISWLASKYEPKLNQFGVISTRLTQLLGNEEERLNISNTLNKFLTLYTTYGKAINELYSICNDSDEELFSELFKLQDNFDNIKNVSLNILGWINNENTLELNINEYDFIVNCDIIEDLIKESKIRYAFQYHCHDIEKIIKQIENLNLYQKISTFKNSLNRNSIVFLGEPGTGKTNGIAAVTQKLINENTHTPIIIQAKSISTDKSWKDILIYSLGLSFNWEETEIWQALCSISNRKKIRTYSNNKINILPKVLIIVDAIDEASDYEYWKNKIRESIIITKLYPQIRFCYTSRPHAIGRQIKDVNFCLIPQTGDVPCYELFDAYMDEFHIEIKDADWLRYSLNTPLTLKLFCETYENQTVFDDGKIDNSLAELIKKKIDLIENEFSQFSKVSRDNQYVLEIIKLLSFKFIKQAELDRENIIDLTIKELKTDRIIAEKLLDYLEKYGVLSKVIYKQMGLLARDKIVYYIGIQGYFDYVIALSLLESKKHPNDIIVDKYVNIPRNTFYILSVIAIQQYNYLIIQNNTIENVIDGEFFDELTFYSLRNSKRVDALSYVEMVKNYMSVNTESLYNTTNKLILPLSRNIAHPLGTSLLHNYLSDFTFPAHRDLIWSVPIIHKGYGDRYYDSGQKVDLDEQAYKLNELDLADGCPTIYAWVLSNVDNDKREYARTELMRWALLSPKEFFKLLVKFMNINDLQVKSDLFSILMCLMFELKDRQFQQQVTEWIIFNVLSTDKIDINRNIAIRYYCISILKKSVAEGIIDEKATKKYLPPYKVKNYNIKLNKEALAGTRMGGYKGISYDLSRYVLIDHIGSYFNSFNPRQENQFEELLNKIVKQQPEYFGISEEQFILSSTFQFIIDNGWNEKEFDFYEFDGNIFRGIDCLIRGVYYPATHGSQSRVMTICEKYVWQARNEIMGFLADRIMTENANKISYVKNYETLENYVVPIRNLKGIKTFSDAYWFLPEKDKLFISKEIRVKDDLISNIKQMPDVDWDKWIFVHISERKYKIDSDTLIALNSYTSLDSVNYIDTVIAIETLLVPKDKLQKFINRIINNEIKISAPSDFEADIDINCYISPKELCWFPWTKQCNDFIFDDNGDLSLIPTTVKCCANIGEDGETAFYMPSKEIRDILGIIQSDNYLFFDKEKNIKAEYFFVGDKYSTHQEYLLVSKDDLLTKIRKRGYELVWLLKEYRQEDMKAKEKFGRFYAEKEICSIGYFSDDKFKIINVYNKE